MRDIEAKQQNTNNLRLTSCFEDVAKVDLTGRTQQQHKQVMRSGLGWWSLAQIMSRLEATRCRTPLRENKAASREQRDTVPYGLIKNTGDTGGKTTRSTVQGGGGAGFAAEADNSACANHRRPFQAEQPPLVWASPILVSLEQTSAWMVRRLSTRRRGASYKR